MGPLHKTRWLVVNADDFGIHGKVNEAVSEGYKRGVITSASLLANGPAFENAIEIARRSPGLDIGVHLNVVQGVPVAFPHRVSGLLNENGMFRGRWSVFMRAVLLGKIKLAELKEEWGAQIEKVLRVGFRPSHLDSHQNIHWHPAFFGLAARLAEEYGIPFIRLPHSRFRLKGFGLIRTVLFAGLRTLTPVYRRVARKKRLLFPQSLELEPTDRMADDLASIMGADTAGVVELVCHVSHDFPGRDRLYEAPFRADEDVIEKLRNAVTPAFLENHGCRLSSFRDLSGIF